MTKKRYVCGQEVVECACGVWKIPGIPCWNESARKYSMVESVAQLNQALRNLGYQVLKAIRLI